MKKEIVMASTNRDKIAEVEEILTEYQVQTLQELGITVEVEEDQETFEANARKKAETIAHAVGGKMCIADDTGIEIEALNGFPGVRTKRWYPGNDAERRRKKNPMGYSHCSFQWRDHHFNNTSISWLCSKGS